MIEHSFTHRMIDNRWRRPAGWILGTALMVIVAFYGIKVVIANANDPVHLVVYAFSTQEEVLRFALFPAFEQAWEAETGQELTIEGVFGPSGTLAGQINLGAPADVALFSNARHVMWLKLGRRVRIETQPVMIGSAPIVIVTRPGNPVGLTEFADLTRPGLRLLHADPHSSGAGEWAVLAEYGSAFLVSGSQTVAERQLKEIWDNVRLLESSARATMSLFELGAGDAFVTYEHDAQLALARGVPLEIVIPTHTILAQHAIVIVDDNMTSAKRPVAEAFIRYLESDVGQQIFSRYHQRPIDTESKDLSQLIQPFTVEDLGGWSRAYDELILSLWMTEIEPHLDLELVPKTLGSGD